MVEPIIVILIPFAGTAAGASLVFVAKRHSTPHIENLLTGIAAGVMVAASVWSLLIPAIDMAAHGGTPSWLPAVVGLWVGIAFLILTDRVAARIKRRSRILRRSKSHGLSRTAMMLLAITIHNIPEGMAVGVTCAGALSGRTDVTMTGAMILSIGIAIQNLPEGAIVSVPLYSTGVRRSKAFLCGMISGIVEPISAALTVLLAWLVVPLLPYLLAFAAGAMLYVVEQELIPDIHNGPGGRCGTLGAGIGFCLMMVLDVALG